MNNPDAGKPLPLAKRAAVDERRLRALEIYRATGSLHDTAKAMQAEGFQAYTDKTAYKDIRACLQEYARLRKDLTEELVDLELLHLNNIQREIESTMQLHRPKAEDPQSAYIVINGAQALLKVSAARRRLLGLDKPAEKTVHIQQNITAAVLKAHKELTDTIDTTFYEGDAT